MSYAFDTLQPHLLLKKLISKFTLESELALWVLDFLVGRPQQVRVNNTTSSVKVFSTGSPQGSKTNRKRDSFIPMSVRLLNDKHLRRFREHVSHYVFMLYFVSFTFYL